MLGTAGPATASIHTSTSSATPTSPTRPSRLRGLSYLRSYTHNHLSSHLSGSRSGGTETPILIRTQSTPESPREASRARDVQELPRSTEPSHIQEGENGWVPTVQGRSGLDRSTTNLTSTSTDPVSPEPRTSMSRTRASTTLGPTPATTLPTPSVRRTSTAEGALVANADMPEPSSSLQTPSKDQLPTIRFIPHVETRSSRPSLHFTALTRTLKNANQMVKVGRYSERDNHPSNPDSSPDVLPVGFKSKVVSRRHCQ